MKLLPHCFQCVKNKFIPPSKQTTKEDILNLHEFVKNSKSLLCLTGAGISTESGIPDYRSEGVGLYARTDRRPMMYQDFLKDAFNRQRYWARNYTGWLTFSSFLPNASHRALKRWEDSGKLKWLVTQNVDMLHTKAGNQNVIELHGCSHRVICLNCDIELPRSKLQKLFDELNPNWVETAQDIAPDADVFLTDDQVKKFKVPPCPQCNGALKPDVTFFGDNVSKDLVDRVFNLVDTCDSMLVCGSSLFVYSGYRFAARAAELKKPLAIVNIGKTRADHLACLKIDVKCGDILPLIDL